MGGLEPPPAGRLRRAYLHLPCSTASRSSTYIKLPSTFGTQHKIIARTEIRERRQTKAWLRLTSWTLGYGYRPWLALVWLAAVATVAVVLTTVAGAAGGLAHPGQSEPCTTMERAAVGVDWSLPLLGTAVRDRCQPTATVTGQWLTAAGWVLRLLGWGFGTLFVAGFTGAVRKTG